MACAKLREMPEIMAASWGVISLNGSLTRGLWKRGRTAKIALSFSLNVDLKLKMTFKNLCQAFRNIGGMNLCQGSWGICEKFVIRDAAARS